MRSHEIHYFLSGRPGKQRCLAGLRFIPVLACLCAISFVGCGKKTVSPPSQTSSLVKSGDIATLQVGESVEGRAITVNVFGSSGPVTFIFAGIHGDEPGTEYIALKLVDYLLSHREVYADCRIAIISAANPDGLLLETRQNARKVDCNRNFPTKNWQQADTKKNSRYSGGQSPLSEPETRAILKAIEMLKPAKIVSIHSWRNKPCVNFDGPARPLAEAMSKCNRYPVKGDIGYSTPGSFGTWAGVERKIPTITLEIDSEAQPNQIWSENRDALLACIRF